MHYQGAMPTQLYRKRLECGMARIRKIKTLPITDEQAKT